MEKMMRIAIATVFLTLGALALGNGQASAQMNHPWCSVTSGIGTECTHPSKMECEQDVQGSGGWCSRNAGYKSDHSEVAHAEAPSSQQSE
ncbi:MAG: hypothetical protein WBE48_14740 [Xanthobacteraceae bacterium]|jgi:hypothetical protein